MRAAQGERGAGAEFLPAALRGREKGPGAAEAAFNFGDLTGFVQDRLQAGSTGLYAEYEALTERHLFEQVLRHTGGNQSQAAKVLGITRGTLRSRLAALGISVERPGAVEAAPLE